MSCKFGHTLHYLGITNGSKDSVGLIVDIKQNTI